MSKIIIRTIIHANIETCFDIARSVEIHEESFRFLDEKAISGKTSGLVQLGDFVSWEVKHLFFVQHITTKITQFKAHKLFACHMVFGFFKFFKQEYRFEALENEKRVVMTNLLVFEPPYGYLGKLVNILFLKRYITCVSKKRDAYIKRKAEASTFYMQQAS